MLRRIAIFIAFFSAPLFATATAPLSFTQYHTQDQINQYMQGLATDNPTMVKFYHLGVSDQKRDINYVTITKGTEQLPALFYNGTHHGDEWSATEGIMGLMDYLIQHQNDAAVSNLLTHYVFYLLPLVNPDGHYNHTREDINGADPNRDYTYPTGDPSTQFKTVIIPLIKSLLDSRKFRAAAAYHSGIEEVLWSWCYTATPTNQNDVLYTMAKNTATSMNFDRYLQSYDDYETEGEFIDYAFWTQGTLALTFEVSTDKTPDVSQLPSIVQRSVTGAMAFAQSVSDYDNGKLTIEKAPTMSHAKVRNPLWDKLGRKLE